MLRTSAIIIIGLIMLWGILNAENEMFLGSINNCLMASGKKALILPTAEKDKTAQKNIHSYVNGFKDKFFKDYEFVDDTTALNMDLSEYHLVAYGTMDGNLWLNGHRDFFPFVINEESVIFEKELKDQGLIFITAYMNPLNPQKSLLIYTAQTAANIAGANTMFHGPSDYVIGYSGMTLYAGDYCKNDGKWIFKTCE
ncbi:hypothetical protein JW877_05880 [bacterium]|nr:hypothetical protein [bacterium]